MRWLLVSTFSLCAAAAWGQALVEPSKIPVVEKYFEPRGGDKPLRCDVSPLPARLNFGLRLQAGYVVEVPMNQFFGAGHGMGTIVRVIPESTKQPVYLASFFRLPNIPKTNRRLEFAGLYQLGEGRYTVDWMLFDDLNRVCRKSWRVEAKLDSNERGLKPGLDPNSVTEVSFRRWSPQGTDADDPPLERLTVLLHAGPLIPNSNRLRAQDRIMLLGSLASLLESIPARSVRLVVFNLDQQKELFREDDLTPDSFGLVAQAMNNVQLQLVDYSVLKNPRGHIELLSGLVNQELRAEHPSDAVIFLGPPTRYYDKLPEAAYEDRSAGGPQFFYFEYKPFWRRAPELPDSIANTVKKLKGKILMIHTPADFAKAIKNAGTQVTTR